METPLYTLTIDGEPRRAGNIEVVMANRQPTQILLTDVMFENGHVLAEADDPGRFAEVDVTFAGLRFVCSFTVFDAEKAGTGWTNTLLCRPRGLHILAGCDYFQEWRSKASADDPATLERSGMVVLNQDDRGAGISLATQLQDIFKAAKTLAQEHSGDFAGWVPSLDFQGAVGAFKLPPDEDRNLTLLDAILKALRMFPGMIVRDVHGEGDRVAILQNPGVWAGAPSKFLADRVRRDDTGVERVDIEFAAVTNGGGASCVTIMHDTAGNPAASPLRTLTGTLLFTTGAFNRTRNGIDIETIEPGLYSLDFWKAVMPGFFLDPSILSITIHGGTREGERDGTAAQYPRVCMNAALPEIEGSGIKVKARMERFSCLANVARKNAAGDKVDVQHEVPVCVDLVATDAKTRRYEWTESWEAESGDPLPHGIAQQILDTYPSTGARVARFYLGDPAGPVPPLPGETYKGLPCQRCKYSLLTMECEADFTPSPEQTLEDRAQLITGFRGRSQSRWSKKSRETGEADDGAAVNRNAAQPVQNAYQSGQGERKMALYTTEFLTDKTIRVDPEDITTVNKAAKMREVAFEAKDPATGETVTRRASFLATRPVGPGDGGGDGGDDGDDTLPPICGHPGNDPGGSGGGGGGGSDHPGDGYHPPVPQSPDPTDHPGDRPSPPCRTA